MMHTCLELWDRVGKTFTFFAQNTSINGLSNAEKASQVMYLRLQISDIS